MADVIVLPEPPLEFRYGQAVEDPHDGLSFGPFEPTLRRTLPLYRMASSVPPVG